MADDYRRAHSGLQSNSHVAIVNRSDHQLETKQHLMIPTPPYCAAQGVSKPLVATQLVQAKSLYPVKMIDVCEHAIRHIGVYLQSAAINELPDYLKGYFARDPFLSDENAMTR